MYSIELENDVLIHSGGHIPTNKEQEFSKIDGIVIVGTLIVVGENYIWTMLEYVKNYLIAAANAHHRVHTD